MGKNKLVLFVLWPNVMIVDHDSWIQIHLLFWPGKFETIFIRQLGWYPRKYLRFTQRDLNSWIMVHNHKYCHRCFSILNRWKPIMTVTGLLTTLTITTSCIRGRSWTRTPTTRWSRIVAGPGSSIGSSSCATVTVTTAPATPAAPSAVRSSTWPFKNENQKRKPSLETLSI